jgi:S1-C subfamily serine protease
VRLGSLEVGEYGFLAPGVLSASISASGKIYTFGVLAEDRETTKGTLSQDEGKTDARAGPDGTVSTPVFSNANIGASTDENPKVRHDGITLDRVTPGGPAERAGIMAGDVILAVDDHYRFTAEELDTEIKHHRPGTQVAVRYRRYSRIYDTSLVVGSGR